MINKPTMPTKLRFVYEKARHHRSFRADGAFATTTPKGDIQMAFFNDLRPLPTEAIHAVTEDGHLGDQLKHELSDEIVLREANVTVVMDRDGARGLIALLQRILAALEGEDSEGQQVAENRPVEAK
jgi:hypothetical protein